MLVLQEGNQLLFELYDDWIVSHFVELKIGDFIGKPGLHGNETHHSLSSLVEPIFVLQNELQIMTQIRF